MGEADMAFDSRGLESYNDVASRMSEFFAKHPEGSLQPADPAQPFEVKAIGEKTFIVYTAAAYRTPDDARPGIGIAWEPFPGRTPYTKDSEIQNAETSAWGRAILAVGAADTRKGVASQEEVRNRQADREDWEQATPARPARPQAPQVSREQVVAKANAAIAAAKRPEDLPALRDAVDARTGDHSITDEDAMALYAAINGREAELTGNHVPAQQMDDRQRKNMFRLFVEIGLDDRDKQMEFLSKLAGRPLASRGELTFDEAALALGALESQKKTGLRANGSHLAAVPS